MSLEEEKLENENAKCARIIGIVLETRPDQISKASLMKKRRCGEGSLFARRTRGGSWPRILATDLKIFAESTCHRSHTACAGGSWKHARSRIELNLFFMLTLPTTCCPDRRLGCTRLQLGIQHTDNEILELNNRGNGVEKSMSAIAYARDAGFKVDGHLMPDLPGMLIHCGSTLPHAASCRASSHVLVFAGRRV